MTAPDTPAPPASSESWRTVAVLGVALALGASTGPLVTMSGGIIGHALAPSPLLATLPVTALIVGVASCAVPAALLMGRLGRRRGFMVGAATGALGASLGAGAIALGSFAAFCGATFVMGAAAAFAQQYRFAAAESVAPAHAGRAVSFVLIGGIAAGALGPEVGRLGRDWFADEFAGAFVIAAAIQTAVVILLSAVPSAPATPPQATQRRTGLAGLIRRPAFALAIATAAAAYVIMSFLMTATPVSMHVVDGHSVDDAARVIQSHVIAMYAPSLLSGWLVDRLGVRRMMAAGTIALGACTAVTLSSHAVAAYWIGLVLLGGGWNLLFVGATVLLTRSYRPDERFRAQAFNDVVVFGSQACASLASGAALYRFGWTSMNAVAAAGVAGVLVLLLSAGSRPFAEHPDLTSDRPGS